MKNLLFLMIFAAVASLQAQVAINIHGEDPDPSAMLDVKATDKGLLIPRLTTQQMQGINNAAEGLLVYNKDEKAFYYFDGTEWILASADNLGNHKATENLQMQGHWITNDGDDEGIFVTEEGHVGIGTDNVVNNKGKKARLYILMDSLAANVVLERNEDSKRVAGFVFLRSRGTNGSKEALQNNDGLASFAASGYDGDKYIPGARINFLIQGNVSPGHLPTRIRFYTRGESDVKPLERMVLDKDGNLGIGVPNPQRKLHINDVMRLEPRDSAPDNPSDGDIYFDSDTGLMFYHNGEWYKVSAQQVNNP